MLNKNCEYFFNLAQIWHKVTIFKNSVKINFTSNVFQLENCAISWYDYRRLKSKIKLKESLNLDSTSWKKILIIFKKCFKEEKLKEEKSKDFMTTRKRKRFQSSFKKRFIFKMNKANCSNLTQAFLVFEYL